MLVDAYAEFFARCGDALHVTAHSHHPWPDVTRAAHAQYWEDSARLTNAKWAHVFGSVVPEAQGHLARWLALPDPGRIVFAPNTHELLARLYSCLDWSRPVRLLTSAHEFTSFARQTRRLEETGRLVVARIAAEPYATFGERFHEALASGFDFVFMSHVFFDTGFHVVDLDAALAGVPERTLVAVDGYHALGAVPVDLSRLAGRIFYLGGGYKYLQAGEGACFMAVPPAGDGLRPAFTGWFAESRAAAAAPLDGAEVAYGGAAARFWGATFDPSGLYRLNAVMRLYAAHGVDATAIHAHVARLMDRFLAGLAAARLDRLPAHSLVPPQGVPRGNFLAFSPSAAAEVEQRLLARDVLVDRRSANVRFGFGVYQDEAFVDRLVERVAEALADRSHTNG